LSHPREPKHRIEETEIEAGNQSQAETAAPEPAAAQGREQGQDAEKRARLEAELDALRHTLVRRQADFENYRKRVERERGEDRNRAVARLAESLLPVLDNFERALAAHQDPAYEDYRRGFAMIHRQLADLLADYGISRMPDPSGQMFDPRLHHALDRVETDEYPDGTVIGEVQAGYKFRDRVLRPAQVRVASGGPGAAASEVN
jgi:molecular chaperone GrpE